MAAALGLGHVVLVGACLLVGCGQTSRAALGAGSGGFGAGAPAVGGTGGTSNGGSAGMAGSGSGDVVASFHWLAPLADQVQLVGPAVRDTVLRTISAGSSADGSVVAGESEMLAVSDSGLNGLEAFRWTEATGTVSLGTPVGLDPNASAGLSTRVSGISADGAVIVGTWSISGGPQGAFRWTEGAGMQQLNAPTGATFGDIVQLSADGSVLLGELTISSGHTRAFRWTSDAGVVVLAPLAGDSDTHPTWLSENGAVVVGSSTNISGDQAFRWTQATGSTGLGLLPGDTSCEPQKLPPAASGAEVIGTCGAGTDTTPFRWTQSSGLQSLGKLPGHVGHYAWSMSADGTAVIGDSTSSSGDQEMFYWSEDSGMIGLGFLPGGVSSSSRPLTGLSADGSVVSGDSNVQGNARAFRWTRASGMLPLAPLAGDNESGLLNMSDDGAVCAGSAQLRQPGVNPTAGPDAVLWDASGSVSSLTTALGSRGVDIGPGNLVSVSVSGHGHVLLGTGNDAQGLRAFVARLQ